MENIYVGSGERRAANSGCGWWQRWNTPYFVVRRRRSRRWHEIVSSIPIDSPLFDFLFIWICVFTFFFLMEWVSHQSEVRLCIRIHRIIYRLCWATMERDIMEDGTGKAILQMTNRFVFIHLLRTPYPWMQWQPFEWCFEWNMDLSRLYAIFNCALRCDKK